MFIFITDRTKMLCFCLALMLVVDLPTAFGWTQSDDSCRTEPVAVVRSMSGLGVFGEGLGLHGTDTLAVWGDLVLEQTQVIGTGTLRLCGKRPALLAAHHSSVQKLHVANTTRVTLQGDLQVIEHLSVDEGVLDVRPGTLRLSSTCRITFGGDGKLLGVPREEIACAQSRAGLLDWQPVDIDWMPLSVWLGWIWTVTQSPAAYQSFRGEAYEEAVWPPPECRFS